MTIKTFIEKAVDGGWIPSRPYLVMQFQKGAKLYAKEVLAMMLPQEILLDPSAWRAVGKVEGWDDWGVAKHMWDGKLAHVFHMHRMVNALCSGQSLEAFIATL